MRTNIQPEDGGPEEALFQYDVVEVREIESDEESDQEEG